LDLLDASEEPKSRTLRYAVSGVALVLLLSFSLWFFVFRLLPERRTVEHFMDAVITGNLQLGYQIWKPESSYSFQDFVADWGEKGYYGPVKSYRIEAAALPRDSSGVDVVVEISPFQPFPDGNSSQSDRTREVHLRVETKDLSMSFPP
jgi:hypothetical protein